MLPVAVLIGGISLGLSARLINRFGERAVLLTGLGLVTAGLVMLARVPVDASFTADLLPAFIALGGTGLVLPSLAALGMSGAGPADAGVASGLFNTTQQIGGALGVAVLSTLVAGRAAASGTEGTEGTGPAQALTDGYHLAFGTGAGLALAAAVVAVTVLRTPGRGSQKVAGAAKRTAAGPVAERSPAAPRS
jgi:MFS family permease